MANSSKSIDRTRYPVAAIWITAPSSRLPDSVLDVTGRKLRAAADVVSERFGCKLSSLEA
jgi:DNA-binding IclR family transcriptional regulator